MYRIVVTRTLWCGTMAIPEPATTDTHADKWQRMKKVFYVDEFGEMTPQLNTMIQTTLFTGFFGSFWGGFVEGRDAYFKFIDRNEVTKFLDHFEAKRSLQQKVTLGFAKGALKWGPRMAIFGGCYISFVTLLAAYRGYSSVLDYTIAGLFSGAIYRIHMGITAMIATGTLGAMMGMFAGALTNLFFRLSGTSLDDIQNYTTQVTSTRSHHYEEIAKKHNKPEGNNLLDHHDVMLYKDVQLKPDTKL